MEFNFMNRRFRRMLLDTLKERSRLRIGVLEKKIGLVYLVSTCVLCSIWAIFRALTYKSMPWLKHTSIPFLIFGFCAGMHHNWSNLKKEWHNVIFYTGMGPFAVLGPMLGKFLIPRIRKLKRWVIAE